MREDVIISELREDLASEEAVSKQLREASQLAIELSTLLMRLTDVKCAGGIYFLIWCDQVVYVGQSKHVLRRVAGHQHKGFDSVKMLACDPKDYDRLELAFIRLFNPRWNTQGKGNPIKDYAIPFWDRQENAEYEAKYGELS